MKLIREKVIKFFIKNFTISFIIILFLTIYFHNYEFKNFLSFLKNTEKTEVLLITNYISDYFNSFETDLKIISESKALKDFIENESETNLKNLEDLFVSMSKYKKIYDQIRYIDKSGNEKCRIDYNHNRVIYIKKNQLQNKSHRYYFIRTISLEKGQLYISPLDLNIENKKIEKPYKPMIRLAVPVFDKYNLIKGMLIINYKAKCLLDNINKLHITKIKNEKIYLLNSNGYWFNHENKEKSFGFMFKDKKDFVIQKEYPKEWNLISKEKHGQIKTKNGIFTYFNILPLDNCNYADHHYNGDKKLIKKYKWVLLSLLTEESLKTIKIDIAKKYIFIFCIVITLIIIIISLLTKERLKREMFQNSQKRLNKKLKKRKNELIKLNESKDMLFSIISHDLLNPFNVILYFSKSLNFKKDKLSENQQNKYIESIYSSSKQVFNLLTNLLQWAKLQQNSVKLHRENNDISGIILENIGLLKEMANRKGIKIINSVSLNTEAVFDYNMIHTVIRNLITNSIKFTRQGGKIEISSTKKDSFVEICIKDNGVGIKENHLKNLFKIKNKVSTKGTADESGTGLGLILCKTFMDINKGRITVKSELNVGTTFKIVIPINK